MSAAGRPRVFSDEQRVERKREANRRASAARRMLFGTDSLARGRIDVLDMPEDHAPMVQAGDVRLSATNLGNGARWIRPRRNT